MMAASGKNCEKWVVAVQAGKAGGRLAGGLFAFTLGPPTKEVISQGEELLLGHRQAECPTDLVERVGALHKELMSEREWRERLQRALLVLEEDKIWRWPAWSHTPPAA